MRASRLLLIALAAVLFLPIASANAKLSATVTVQPDGNGTRVVAALTSDKALAKRKRPNSVSLAGKNTTFALTKVKGTAAPGTWRSALLTGKRAATAQGLIGSVVRVIVTAPQGKSTLSVTALAPPVGNVPGTQTPTGTTTPTPIPGANPTPAPTPTPAPAPTSLFGTPSAPLVGQPALDALLPYFTNARFTDCPLGWPNCAVEERYGIYANGNQWYCRLTFSSGADIHSFGNNLTVTGASQAVDGSWAISYAILTYSNIVNYRWDVSPLGAATGAYWREGVNVNGPPTSTMTGMQWMRGAMDCP
jgi:hypothetical protein